MNWLEWVECDSNCSSTAWIKTSLSWVHLENFAVVKLVSIHTPCDRVVVRVRNGDVLVEWKGL
jgi:hypothetical protein